MNTPDPTALPLTGTASSDHAFPTLTPRHMARIAAHGRRRTTTRGEVLVEAGDRAAPFFLVVAGEVEVLRFGRAAEAPIVTLQAGQFSGEGNMITGRRAIATLRVTEPGELIELNREQLLGLIQTDAELSETLIRAFILRRLRFIERDLGDVVVVGSPHKDPAILLHTQTEIVALEGNGPLERIRWRDDQAGAIESHDIGHVFMMTGAASNTRWLDGCLLLDEKGFVKTGPDLSSDELAKATWPLARPPYLLETSRPGIFAVGDVRGGNVKRVASAVGEGSIAVAFVHQVLRQ